MKKIIFFLPELAVGGAERVLVTIAQELSKRHRILFAYGKWGPLGEDLGASIELIPLFSGRASGCLLPLIKTLRRERPDWLISTLNYANLISVLAKIAARTDVRVAVREATSWTRFSDARNTGRVRMIGLSLPLAFRFADLILSPSFELNAEMRKYGVESIFLRNPVVTTNLSELAKSELEFERPFLLAVGRLVWEKGFDVLIESWALSGLGTTHDLIILGEGPERRKLEELATNLSIADRVKMPGFEANPFSYMANTDLFVLSSRFEGMPNVLIQALACGARVVATDCETGPREVLEDGKWGTLVPVDDVQAMAAGLKVGLNSLKPNGIDLSAYKAQSVAAELERMLEEFDA